MSPVVSIVICTHNRVRNLRDAVESVLSQGVDEHFFELLIVDNASTDGTHELISARAARAPNLKYLSEPMIGESHARNRGVGAAKGQYIAFIDDDAIADAGWLSQIPAAFDVGGTDVGCVAGKIVPIWDAPRPTWLHDALLGYISVLDISPTASRLGENQYPYGANVIYRRDALLRVEGFSPRLGRKGNSLLSNAEILLHHLLTRLGYATYYDPRVSVRHHVHAARLNKRWFRRRAYMQGVSDALMESHLKSVTAMSLEIKRLRMLKSIARHPSVLSTVLNFSDDDPARFLSACSVLWKLGYATASIHALRS
jgi:glucosyl-dolichyl phosphate glucuronosyltransferase